MCTPAPLSFAHTCLGHTHFVAGRVPTATCSGITGGRGGEVPTLMPASAWAVALSLGARPNHDILSTGWLVLGGILPTHRGGPSSSLHCVGDQEVCTACYIHWVAAALHYFDTSLTAHPRRVMLHCLHTPSAPELHSHAGSETPHVNLMACLSLYCPLGHLGGTHFTHTQLGGRWSASFSWNTSPYPLHIW